MAFSMQRSRLAPIYKRVTIFQSATDEYRVASSLPIGQPIGAFEIASGDLIAQAVFRNFRAIGATPSGEKLIGARRVVKPGNESAGAIEIQLADIATGNIEPLAALEGNAIPVLPAREAWPTNSAMSPDGRWLAIADGSAVRIREIAGSGLHVVPLRQEQQFAWVPSDIRQTAGPKPAFRLDGRLLAIVSFQHIYLLSVPDFQIIHTASHGHNLEKNSITNRQNGMMRPFFAGFLADRRLAAGFTLHKTEWPRWQCPGR